MLRAHNLGKQVTSPAGRLTILEGVELDIQAGESLAILGVSGSGKSTLLGLLAGLDQPTTGRVWLDEVEITALDEDGRAALRAASVGFIFQSFHLLGGLTALENVMLPLELAGERPAHERALETLAAVGLSARAAHYPYTLSGGEQQRVAIARAFASEPRVLFADEPTGNLDSATGQRIIEALFELNTARATTLVLVTHDKRLAARCERVLTLTAGRLSHTTPPERVRETGSGHSARL